MSKKISIVLLILLIFNHLFGQSTSENFLIKKYNNSNIAANNSTFYLVQFTYTTPDSIKKRCELLALRKLSSSSFIIRGNPLFLSLLAKNAVAVCKANNTWKLSPMAESLAQKNKKALYRYTIGLTDLTFWNDVLSKKISKAIVHPGQKLISIETNYDTIASFFLEDNRVIYIDAVASPPAAELGIEGFDLSANYINSAQTKYPGINGEGMHISLKEDYYDTTDIDLKGRFDNSPLASKNITNHANFMATIIAGAGNSVYYARGVARAAHISSSSFKDILPDEDAYYTKNEITVQNHSYGTVIDNNYGLNAVAFDKSASNNIYLSHVFSSGNTGNATSESGKYSGIPGFANLTGNFKMAKNIITVGAADSFGNSVVQSSRGPAYDGRIKPDIAAFQKNGTSESAALVSGTIALIQQLFKFKNNGDFLPFALARAILINSADDVADPGPDYATGFGNLNAQKAMEIIEKGNFFTGTVNNGTKQAFTVSVPAGTAMLKVSLSWNDTAALPNAPTALVNDLDLTVTNQSTGETWQPWVLSSVANIDSLSKKAVRKRDSLNNEEQVTISNPSAGNYQFSVNGFNVTSASQKFYIAYQADSSGFSWSKFSSADFAQSNNEELIKWKTDIAGTGTIEYALSPFDSWKAIQQNVDFSIKYLYWHTPDTTAKAMLRVKARNSFYYSDTFLITTLATPTTGFFCGDSLFIYWAKLKGINKYQVYQLGKKYMEPLITTNDTTLTINAINLHSHYLAVAPVLPDGTISIKSFGFDYTAQNAGCYVSSFYADTHDNTATLSLLLGTLYKIDSVYIQKYTAAGFEDIGKIALVNTLSYQYAYHPLSKGITVFRAKIILSDGKIIYSDKIQVYYNLPGQYLVFPIPAKRNQKIEIFTPTPQEEELMVFDAAGRTVLKKQIQSVHEFISTASFSPGIYIYHIYKKDGSISIGKMIIL